ncbi:uncharacterized protein LOC131013276 [Salvia miltiorrhiza]|uniref:uncharacterized protein LOC131013276 n=1 Tax=Salvia miltiorrhiza TaxID=226208 RepID=UPI0025ACD6F1|nr:uncharacterized protein LOC131013276 [Salvia miltiorrhiza]
MDEHILKSFNGGGDKKHYLSTMSAQDMSPKEGFETTNLFSYDYRTQHVGGNTCRGLLYFNFDDQIVLCNLRTKELKFVAPPKKPIPSHTWFNGCGLGYDSKSGDYKLIRNYYRWSCCNGGDDEDEDSEYFYQHRCGPHEEKTELYSLKSDSWKEIPTPDAYIDLIHMCGVYVEVSCYWPARQGSAFGGRRSREDVCDILSFDFTDESFSWIPSPISDYRFQYDLVECRGFLGAIAYENTYGSPKCGVNSFELWVRKERSWAKSFVVAVYGIEKPLGLKDGRFLFLQRKGVDQLLVYDYITKEMKKPDIDARAQNVEVVSYVENKVVLVYDLMITEEKMMKVLSYVENSAMLPNDAKTPQNAEESVLEISQNPQKSKSLRVEIHKEITEEILSRLPVKSLLRFRCVSTSWRSLIDSKRFIKTHLQNSARNPSLAHHKVLLHNKSISKKVPTLMRRPVLDSSEDEALELEFPIDFNCIVGCCNGLVCLVGYKQFVLWNPSTGISKKLKREVLGAVELPESREGRWWEGIGVIGECLSLYNGCEDSSYLEIWMKKESWEKVVVLDQKCNPLHISPALAPFWGGGFLLIKIGNFLVFDGKGFRKVVSLKDSDVYIESLISPLDA